MKCPNNHQECLERLRQRLLQSDYKYDAIFRAVLNGSGSAVAVATEMKPLNSITLQTNEDVTIQNGFRGRSVPQPSSIEDFEHLLDDEDFSEILPINNAVNRVSVKNYNDDFNLSVKRDISKKIAVSTPFTIDLINIKRDSVPLNAPNQTIEVSSDNNTSPLISTAKKRRHFVIDDEDDSYDAEGNPPVRKISPEPNSESKSASCFRKGRLYGSKPNVASPLVNQPLVSHSELLKENYSIMMQICDLVEQSEKDKLLMLPSNLKELFNKRRTLLAQIRDKPMFQTFEDKQLLQNGDSSVYVDAASTSLVECEQHMIRSPPCKRQDQKPTPLKLRNVSENHIPDMIEPGPRTNTLGSVASVTSQFKEIESSPLSYDYKNPQHNYFGSLGNEEDESLTMPSITNMKQDCDEYFDVDTDPYHTSVAAYRKPETSGFGDTASNFQSQTNIGDIDDLSDLEYEDDDQGLTRINTKPKESDVISVITLDSQSSTVNDQILNAALRAESNFVQLDLNKSVVHDGNKSEEQDMPNAPQARFFGLYQNDANEPMLKSKNLPHSKKMLQIFHDVFGLRSFRTNQLEAINAALLKHDVFVLMPTGGGKSLCYQLPALVTPGVTVIVSPLRSLIQDQIAKMNSKMEGSAAALTGDIDSATISFIYSDLRSENPTIKLLYVTPEKLSASGSLGSILMNLYNRNCLARFVIDEAHCVSQWGHDFRPDYKRLSNLRHSYGKVPFMALTATATQKVRVDIAQQLGLREAKWFMQSFNRDNLKFEVRPKTKTSFDEIADLLQTEFRKYTGIIYCLSRNDCDSVAEKLQVRGLKAISYHAGLNDEVRRKTQEDWIKGKFNIVVATIAFGMGIDKTDCRFVIHYSMPKSVEGYYQEVGRAGRDGALANCILYYTPNDFSRWKKLISKTTNKGMQKVAMEYLYDVQMFCMNKAECRRKQLLRYFGENYDDRYCFARIESVCDNCLVKDNFATEDLTRHVKAILESIRNLVGPFGQDKKDKISPRQLISIISGGSDPYMKERHTNSTMFGILAHLTRTDNTRLIQNLIAKKYLAEDTVMNKNCAFASASYVRLGEKASNILLRGEKFIFSVTKKKSAATTGSAAATKKPAPKGPAAKKPAAAKKPPKRSTLEEAINMHTKKSNKYFSDDDAVSTSDSCRPENSLIDFIVPDDVFDDDDFDLYRNNMEQPKAKRTKRAPAKAPAKPRATVKQKASGYFNKNGQKSLGKKPTNTKVPPPIMLDEDDDGFINIPD